MKRHRISWQESLLFTVDILIVALSYAVAYFLRFDGAPSREYLDLMIRTMPLVLAMRTAVLIYFQIHRSVRGYASIKDFTQIIKAVSVSSIFIVAIVMLFRTGHPRSIFIIDWLLLLMGLSGVRLVIRMSRPMRWQSKERRSRRKKVIIVGAGDCGESLLREMIYHYSDHYEVVGLIDDDPRKQKVRIHGVAVLGTRFDIPDIVSSKNIEEVVIAIPSLRSDQMRDIVNYCIKSGAKYRTVPSISDVVNGRVKVKELREVSLEDLLGREELQLDRKKIESYIKGKKVLITGAEGSIGSELSRQIARLSPEKLILFGKTENSMFYLDMELRQSCGEIDRVAVIGDILDRRRVAEVIAEHAPHIIFHAAAYKHVPLMEINPYEAIKTNVFGTKVLAEEACRFGVEKFIMLSSDKAVDPVSFMGVSKRIAEIYIAEIAKNNKTKFMAVRFGNVLGSAGSVIQIFKRQIEKGGPVTVTHPEIKRYFMTIPEAVGLVLESGFMGKGGEIFILDMGRQIKIIDLARDLVRLSGLEPDRDIPIVFTGLRPGEKMYETVASVEEQLIKTMHKKIFLVDSQKLSRNTAIVENLKALEALIDQGDIRVLVAKLKEMVPNYHPSPQALLACAKNNREEKMYWTSEDSKAAF